MSQRENVLKVYRHEKPDFTPVLIEAVNLVGFYSANECGQRGEEVRPGITLDCFGCEWDQTHGQPTPYPGNYILEDIADWREVIEFPDVESWDWEGMARFELDGFDREAQALLFFDEMGVFDRLTTVMGFEESLMALITEPEEVYEFFQAVADYKIKVVKLVKEAFDPDIFMYSDDIAKVDGLFMHPDTYRALIKPAQRRIIQAIHEHGMIAQQHTCGKCEDVVGDYVEVGVDCFFPAQSSNDIVGLRELYGDKLVFCGGFDSQGAAGRNDATEEITRAEARRCVNEYAVGGSYICLPMIGTAQAADEGEMVRIGWFLDEFHKECARLGV